MRRHLSQRLKLHMLRIADAIESQGSILRASSLLHLSQPAVTKHLQELEEIIGTRLFERHSRGVTITKAGSRVVATSRSILAELMRLEDDLDHLSAPKGGLVNVGVLPVAAAGMLPGILSRLRGKHPDVGVGLHEARTEELLPLLAAGEIDFIVGRLYEQVLPDGLHREILWMEPISLLARTGHPIFEKTQPTLQDIQRYELVLPTMSQRVGAEIDHILSLLGLEPTPSMRSNSYGFIREMMHATDILSVMPRLMMVGDLLRGTLRMVPLPVPAPERPAGLILPRNRQLSAAGVAFVNVIRTYVEEISTQGLTESRRHLEEGGDSLSYSAA
ncbi:MAG TPA: LysR substrate-binding domain-containing protein [Stellaceae bacterium]|nr:LysR substrate-binding domain-containing protein [Stellaceae bacterium]